MSRQTRSAARYDVVIAADMSAGGDRAFRIALEASHYSRAGCRVGLLHAPDARPFRPLSQDIAVCIRRGSAHPVDAAVRSTAQLLIVHGAKGLLEGRLPKVSARKTVIVAHESRDYSALGGNAPRGVSWAPTSDDVRAEAPKGRRLSRVNWLPPELSSEDGVRVALQETAAIGWIVGEGSDAPVPGAVPDTELFSLLLDSDPAEMSSDPRVINLGANEISLGRLTGQLSALAYFPSATAGPPPDALIMTALRTGMPVALPPDLRGRYLKGPIYCNHSDAALKLSSLMTNAKALGHHRNETRLAASASLATTLPRVRAEVPQTLPDTRQRPVIFMAGGGTGLGHVTRLLAIARKLDPQIPVLFVCQGDSIAAIEQLGYAVEYIPSASSVGGSTSGWNLWLRFQLDDLFDRYDPALVVFDGNHLYPGLAKAVASRPDCKLGWVRRGLWGKSFSRYIANARWCDLIIEPGELPGQVDDGVTARRRSEVHLTPPIRLLDAPDLLSRQEARKVLGLDPDKPAVLLQLGANGTRDNVTLLEWLSGELRNTPNLQICVSEFGAVEFDIGCWPGLTHLHGYPVSQFIHAFDFCVSAAGYNTFHEAIALAVPTVFVPNSDPTMDDQVGRAEHAQSLGAAFVLDEDGKSDLPNIIKLLLEPKGRSYLADNCRRVSLPNGAAPAATLLTAMLRAAA